MREVKKGYKIIKVGNSQGIIIEKKTLEYLNLNLGDWVELVIKKAEIES